MKRIQLKKLKLLFIKGALSVIMARFGQNREKIKIYDMTQYWLMEFVMCFVLHYPRTFAPGGNNHPPGKEWMEHQGGAE